MFFFILCKRLFFHVHFESTSQILQSLLGAVLKQKVTLEEYVFLNSCPIRKLPLFMVTTYRHLIRLLKLHVNFMFFVNSISFSISFPSPGIKERLNF